MNRLDQLYQEMIVDHNKSPKNFSKMEDATHVSHGKNPLCGDDYYVFCKVHGDVMEDISFHGCGCAISKSSGSLMTHTVKGKDISDILALKELFLSLLTTDELSSEQKKELGKLQVFEGVKQFPVRVKCAALVWRALEDALETSTGEVSTE